MKSLNVHSRGSEPQIIRNDFGELIAGWRLKSDTVLALYGQAIRDIRDSDPSFVVVNFDGYVLAPVLANQAADAGLTDDVGAYSSSYSGFYIEIDLGRYLFLKKGLEDKAFVKIHVGIAGGGDSLQCVFDVYPGDISNLAVDFVSLAKLSKDQCNKESALAFYRRTIIQSYAADGREIELNIKETKKKKLAICCSYFESTSWMLHHKCLFSFLKKNDYFIVNVHALGSASLADANCSNLIDVSVIKVNEGYDFGSWLVGFVLTANFWDKFDSIVFVNDSNLGPVETAEIPLADFIARQTGFFGMINSFAHRRHIQSFLFGVGRDEYVRAALQSFFWNFSPTSVKEHVVVEGEIGLSSHMAAWNIEPAVYVGYAAAAETFSSTAFQFVQSNRSNNTIKINEKSDNIDSFGAESIVNYWNKEKMQWYSRMRADLQKGIPHNPTHIFWQTLIEDHNFPFVKRELLTKNPVSVGDAIDFSSVIGRVCVKTYEQYVEICGRAGIAPRVS